jgi:hypothetical protein
MAEERSLAVLAEFGIYPLQAKHMSKDVAKGRYPCFVIGKMPPADWRPS